MLYSYRTSKNQNRWTWLVDGKSFQENSRSLASQVSFIMAHCEFVLLGYMGVKYGKHIRTLIWGLENIKKTYMAGSLEKKTFIWGLKMCVEGSQIFYFHTGRLIQTQHYIYFDALTNFLFLIVIKLMFAGSIDAVSISSHGEPEDMYQCSKCSESFPDLDVLYQHQNESGHLELTSTPRGPGYLCWKKACNQYFATTQALQVHFREIHAKVDKKCLKKSQIKMIYLLCFTLKY